MGNTQSNGGNFEPAQLEAVQQSLSQLNLDHDNQSVTLPTVEHRVRPEARQQISSHLLDSVEEIDHPGVSQSSSNTTNMRSETQHVSDGDITSNPQSEFEAAMTIINHMKKTASPDQLAVLQHAMFTFNNNSSPNSSLTTITPPPKDHSPKNSKVMRRRSLFSTPALVSRSKKKKSTPDLTSHQTWSPEMFTSSPLSKIAGWESKDDGAAEIARSETPDATSTYLGTHQLGSLRITNGMASPEPSIYEMRPKTMESAASSRHEGYYTASEGSGRDSPAKSEDVSSRRASAERSELQTVPEVFVEEVDDADVTVVQGLYPGSVSGERPVSALNMYTVEASSNPFLATAEPEECEPQDLGKSLCRDSTSSERPVSALNMYTLEASSNPFLATSGQEERNPEVTRDTVMHTVEASSNSFLAIPEQEEHEPESLGNYEDASEGQRVLELQPAPEAMIGPERSQDGHPYGESIYSDHLLGPQSRQSWEVDRLTALRRLSAGSYSKSGILSASSSVYSSANQRKPVGSQRFNYSSIPKPDSGYTSLISISDDHDNASTPAPVDRLQSQEGEEPATSEEAVYDAIDGEQQRSLRRYSFTPSQHELASASQNVTPILSPPSTPHKSRATSLETQRPLLEPSPTSSSAKSSPRMKQAQRKLQKRRPFSERYNSAPLIVQTAVSERSFNDGLPRIPTLISSRHSDRMVKRPDMEHLERTFKSVSHSNSRDSLNNTNFSPVCIQFPSSTHTPDISDQPNYPSRGRDNKKPPKPRSSSGRFFRSRSRKSKERQPLDGSDDEDGVPTGVTDFGTVAESLGSSPYDMAAAAGSMRNRNGDLREATAPMHPHQLGGVPRRKIGMSDEQASEFALARSRDRLENMDARDQERIVRHRDMAGRRRQSFGVTMRKRPFSFDSSSEKRLSHPPPREQLPERESMEVIASPVQDRRQPEDVSQVDYEWDCAEQEDRVHYRYDDEPNQTPVENHAQSSYRQDVAGSPEHEQLFSWEQSARAWRLRRQNINEDLQHSHNQPDYQHNDPQSIPRVRTPLRRYSEELHPMHFDDEEQPSLPLPFPRVKSPTPSVLERAAAYERSISPVRQLMPDRSAPSPPKKSPPPLKRSPSPPNRAPPIPPTKSASPSPAACSPDKETQHDSPAEAYPPPSRAQLDHEHARSGYDSRLINNAIRSTYLCYEGLRPQSRGYPEPEVAQYQKLMPETAQAEAEAPRPLTRGQKLGLAMAMRAG